jgi:hypothetical protein
VKILSVLKARLTSGLSVLKLHDCVLKCSLLIQRRQREMKTLKAAHIKVLLSGTCCIGQELKAPKSGVQNCCKEQRAQVATWCGDDQVDAIEIANSFWDYCGIARAAGSNDYDVARVETGFSVHFMTFS